jgi:hypothetical protein
MRRKWRLDPSRFLGLMLLFIVGLQGIPNASAYSNKLDFTFGGFSINATNSSTNKTAKVSGVGAYQVRYRRAITRHVDFLAGYSLHFQKVFTGDSIYGLDFGVIYFPLTASGAVTSRSEDVEVVVSETWRPFIMVDFLQRNFQGIQTTYTGFGGGVGTEWRWTDTMGVIGQVRGASLSAGQGTSATEISVSGGLVIGF